MSHLPPPAMPQYNAVPPGVVQRRSPQMLSSPPRMPVNTRPTLSPRNTAMDAHTLPTRNLDKDHTSRRAPFPAYHPSTQQSMPHGMSMQPYVSHHDTVHPTAKQGKCIVNGLCCALGMFAVVGLVLIIVGAILYGRNDDYIEVRTRTYQSAVQTWTSVCQPKIAQQIHTLRVSVVKQPRKTPKTTALDAHVTLIRVQPFMDLGDVETTVEQSNFVTHVKSNPSHHTSYTISAALPAAAGVPIAMATVPARKEVQVPALCLCKLLSCKCAAKDLCGQDMQFEGDLHGCSAGKICGRCTGRGYLQRACIFMDVCDQSPSPPPKASGCTYPLENGSHAYTAKPPKEIEVVVRDVRIPEVAKVLIAGGPRFDAESMSKSVEQQRSRRQGTILMSVGATVLGLALLGLLIALLYHVLGAQRPYVHRPDVKSPWTDEISMHGIQPSPYWASSQGVDRSQI